MIRKLYQTANCIVYTTDTEDEAEKFSKRWGGSYKEIVSFPNNYFKIEI